MSESERQSNSIPEAPFALLGMKDQSKESYLNLLATLAQNSDHKQPPKYALSQPLTLTPCDFEKKINVQLTCNVPEFSGIQPSPNRCMNYSIQTKENTLNINYIHDFDKEASPVEVIQKTVGYLKNSAQNDLKSLVFTLQCTGESLGKPTLTFLSALFQIFKANISFVLITDSNLDSKQTQKEIEGLKVPKNQIFKFKTESLVPANIILAENNFTPDHDEYDDTSDTLDTNLSSIFKSNQKEMKKLTKFISDCPAFDFNLKNIASKLEEIFKDFYTSSESESESESEAIKEKQPTSSQQQKKNMPVPDLQVVKQKVQEIPKIPTHLKKEIKFVCIGKTGAGKTTLINTLINQAYKRSYLDERLIAITQNLTLTNPKTQQSFSWKLKNNLIEYQNAQSDERSGSTTNSQTSEVNSYPLELDEIILTIVDTPGLADTNGVGQDEINIQEIVRGVAALGEFHAILFVQKATDTRKDTTIKYLLSEIQGMLPKSCEDNFFTCLTAVVNPLKLDVLPVLEEMNIPTTQLFTFENDCLMPPKHLIEVADFKDGDPRIKALLGIGQSFWSSNSAEVERMIDIAKKLKPASSKAVFDLHKTKKLWFR